MALRVVHGGDDGPASDPVRVPEAEPLVPAGDGAALAADLGRGDGGGLPELPAVEGDSLGTDESGEVLAGAREAGPRAEVQAAPDGLLSSPTRDVAVKALALLGVGELLGAESVDLAQLPPWLYAIVSIVGAFGWVRYYFLPRAERRLREATASKASAESDKVSVDAAHEAVTFVREEYQRVTEQMQHERERADTAHSQLTTAQSGLAGAQAQLAEAVARASNDRTSLQRQIHALEEQLHVEREGKRALRDELDSIRAQLGQVERRGSKRRETDPPPSLHQRRIDDGVT